MELPPRDNSKPFPFAQLMALEQLDDATSNSTPASERSLWTFRSLVRAFRPGDGIEYHLNLDKDRTYGGHVFAQAVWAASQTLAKGFVIHNVTGFFVRLGASKYAFTYAVRKIRDGKTFCVRSVEAIQQGQVFFTCICSFKVPEDFAIEFQDWEFDLKGRYESVLGNTDFHEHADARSHEALWFRKLPEHERAKAFPFPGLTCKMVNMDAYEATRPSTLDKRQLFLYQVIGDMPSPDDQPNLHACAHLYASDRNGLFKVATLLGVHDYMDVASSLSHTVVFHCTKPKSLAMIDTKTSEKKWFVQEIRTDRASDGRISHITRIWDTHANVHIASTVQDGLYRLKFDSKEQAQSHRKRLGPNAQKQLKL